MRSLLAVAVLATTPLVLASPQVGRVPPEMKVSKWYNTPPLTLEQLTGKGVLIEVFRTWWGPCLGQIPTLNSHWEKDQPKGLVVIGVTDESAELVNKWFAKNKPKYPIAILSNGEEFENFLGVDGFPAAAVIAPDGKVSYSGSAWDVSKSVDEALEKAQKGSLWPKSLEKVIKLISAGTPGEAYAEVMKQIQTGKLVEDDHKKAVEIRAYLEGLAATSLAEGRTLLEQGFAHRALQGTADFRSAKPPFPSEADIQKLVEEIEALPSFKNEVKGGELFAEAEDLESEGEFTKAFEQYRTVVKTCADAKIAVPARAAAERLIKDGMPGFKKACNSCRSAKRACAKHKEEVKL